MKTYTIYKLTAPNDEVYIGQTSSLEKRFYYYKSKHCKTQFLICNSINKYGWEAFKKEIVETGLSKDKANFLEVSLIKEFKDKKI